MNHNEKQIKILILGLGNELLTDDGVGIHVVRQLQNDILPDEVITAEVGTGILHAQHLLEQAEYVIAVDAVQAGDVAGSICQFNIEEAEMTRPASLHDLGIVGILQLMPEYLRPEIIILGVEPAVFDYGMELSELVNRAVPKVVKLIKEMIRVKLSGNNSRYMQYLDKNL